MKSVSIPSVDHIQPPKNATRIVTRRLTEPPVEIVVRTSSPTSERFDVDVRRRRRKGRQSSGGFDFRSERGRRLDQDGDLRKGLTNAAKSTRLSDRATRAADRHGKKPTPKPRCRRVDSAIAAKRDYNIG